MDFGADESKFTDIWLFCFEEAWEAYCKGSIPIGAAIVDDQERIIAKGRNRFFEKEAEAGNICWNRLAHAEINAMVKVSSHEHPDLKSYTLYTTVEPCVQCFGALYMSNIGNLKYAAKDKIAGGVNLYRLTDTFKIKEVNISGPEAIFGDISIVINVDFELRTRTPENAARLLNAWRQDHPAGVRLGEHWHQENRLQQYKQQRKPISEIIEEIRKELLDKD